MSVRALSVDLRVHNMHLRMPFRYGIVTLTALPHLFVTLEAEIDGKRQRGVAADHLPPKWFTKNPSTHFRDDLKDMTDCIRAACRHAQEAGEHETVFDWWGHVYGLQKNWAAATTHPPLLWGFGVSLVERAMIDAFCRSQGTTFAAALHENTIGMRLEDFTPRLDRARPSDLLPAEPLTRVIARHTVGLVDPLTNDDIPPADRVNDGLPQSLEDAIRVYGLKHFKIKLGGDVAADAQRLRRLADLITRLASSDFAFTLDANENFKEVEPFKQLWLSLAADPSLKNFLSRLIFIEQPLHRDVALTPAVKSALTAWPDHPPLIIDESDAELSSLQTALDCGYNGTSHKNCKGVFKSIANACLLESLRRQRPGGTWLMSGEDLSNVGPVALLQDLVVAASLGIESIERNGQHYFKGLSMFPEAVQRKVLAAHPDLFHRRGDVTTLRIDGGALEIDSLLRAPFGIGYELDVSSFTPLDQWHFDSLGLR